MRKCCNPDCGYETDDDTIEYCPKMLNEDLKCNHEMIKKTGDKNKSGIHRKSSGIHKSSIFHNQTK